MDMGIVNAGALAIYDDIDPALRELVEDVVLDGVVVDVVVLVVVVVVAGVVGDVQPKPFGSPPFATIVIVSTQNLSICAAFGLLCQ